MKHIFLIVSAFSLANYINSQMTTVETTDLRNQTLILSCDDSSKSFLVEQFFSIVFNEFYNTPPVCVCVQMCPNQPTYCHPNGCLKESNESYAQEKLVTHIGGNNKAIQDNSDFINNLMNYVDEHKVTTVPNSIKQISRMPTNIRSEPFKNRYNNIFRYKKVPKVEVRYNLGEQVKNKKSDSLNMDISRTRWPRNKINHRYIQRDGFYKYPESRYFMSKVDKQVMNYSYFNGELNNTSNNDQSVVNAIPTVEISESEKSTISLEKLIDSLIENSFEINQSYNSTKENMSNNEISINAVGDLVTNMNSTAKKLNELFETPPSKEDAYNITTNIISMNFTDESAKRSIYNETNAEVNKEIQNKTYTLSDAVISLSKKIEIQNNTSLEMLTKMGGEVDFGSAGTIEKHINISSKHEFITITTTENTIASFDIDNKTTKKSRQILARKLRTAKTIN